MKVEKTPIAIPSIYINFVNVFFLNLIAKLPEHTRINDLVIKLIDGKWSLYDQIYGLELVELETLKAYIKINIANGFIRLFKFLTETLIFFV